MTIPTPDDIRTDCCASFWLKDALAGALVRDPVDAVRDAELLLAVLRERADLARRRMDCPPPEFYRRPGR